MDNSASEKPESSSRHTGNFPSRIRLRGLSHNEKQTRLVHFAADYHILEYKNKSYTNLTVCSPGNETTGLWNTADVN